MTDDVGADEKNRTASGADDVPTWTGLPVGGAAEEGEDMAASRWIEVAEDPGPTRQRPVTLGEPGDPSERSPVVDADQNHGPAAAGAVIAVALERPRKKAGRRLAVALAAVTVLAAAGLAGWTLGRASLSSTETDTGDDGLTATADQGDTDAPSDSELTDSATGADVETGSDDIADTTTTVELANSPGSTSETSEPNTFIVPDTPDNPSGATQYAVMADGKAVMRGWYPSQERAQAAVADAAVIMGGTQNVVDETQVDAAAEIRPDTFAVYLQDFILFESDSSEITPEFYDFLAFPLFFMQNSPDATVTVVARTDARGAESYNLDLATRRAEAVRDHWLANGANADQIILDPRGEQEADEDADDEQAALDRRVELQVSGFLAG